GASSCSSSSTAVIGTAAAAMTNCCRGYPNAKAPPTSRKAAKCSMACGTAETGRRAGGTKVSTTMTVNALQAVKRAIEAVRAVVGWFAESGVVMGMICNDWSVIFATQNA